MKKMIELTAGALITAVVMTGCTLPFQSGTSSEREALHETVNSGEEETAPVEGSEVTGTDASEETIVTETDDTVTEPSAEPTESELFPEYSELINMISDYLQKMEIPEDQRPIELTELERLGAVIGIAEVLDDENAYDELSFAAADINDDGIEEFFIMVNDSEDDRPYIAVMYTHREDGSLYTSCAGWQDSRLYYQADGDFLRISREGDDIITIEPEVADDCYGPVGLGITYLYYTNGNVDGNGDLILYQSTDKWNPDYGSTEVVWGRYADYPTEPELYVFSNEITFADYFGEE